MRYFLFHFVKDNAEGTILHLSEEFPSRAIIQLRIKNSYGFDKAIILSFCEFKNKKDYESFTKQE